MLVYFLIISSKCNLFL